jgi:O-antigen ligase
MLLDMAVSSGLPALAGWGIATVVLAYRLLRCGSQAAQLALAILAATVLAGTLEYSILVSTHFRGIWVIVTALACCTLNTDCETK